MQKALVEAETALAEPEPKGKRIVRNLKTATEILAGTAETVQAAGKIQTQVIKLAPTGALFYSIARVLFGV